MSQSPRNLNQPPNQGQTAGQRPPESGRVKAGIAVLCLLIVITLYVHGDRWWGAKAPQAPTAGTSQTGQTGQTGRPPQTGATATGAAPVTQPASSSQPLDHAAALEHLVETQIASLQTELKHLEDRLAKIPEPFPPPDPRVTLPPTEREFFARRPDPAARPDPAPTRTAGKSGPPASIIGYFTVRGNTKVLVQTASSTFVVYSDGDEPIRGRTTLTHENGHLVLRDQTGKVVVRDSQISPNASLQAIMQVFQGTGGQ